ncbi:MAG: right-handed parallel beta-helix repeat-containing protein [Alphaproteobacteria bacterium]|nr:right-handed parallel beta-helix repeat-containing protein [Alphaproteobacteria bacterium]
MEVSKSRNVFVFSTAFCLAFSLSIGASYADHEAGHDEVARGGIKALEQRVWDLENGITTPLPQPSVKAVDCGSESLQDALDQAVEGDTLNVTGTCNEQIVIRQDRVTLDGQGSAIIDGTGLGGAGTLVRVRAMLVRFQNFTVKDSPRHGIQVHRSGSAIIEGNTIQDSSGDGIILSNSAYAQIGPGSGDHPAAGTGRGNLIQVNGRHGINVRGAAHASIFHNKIANNGIDGIHGEVGGVADIDGNEITGNSRGIRLRTNAVAKLSDHPNHYDTNPGLGSIENNKIQDNGVGLHCRLGGALNGNLQNFGTGNTADTDFTGSCHVNSDVHIP